MPSILRSHRQAVPANRCFLRSGIAIACLLATTHQALADDKQSPATNQTLRGRVVFLAKAMEKDLGVVWVPEAAERVLALQTAQGELVPLVEDIRGRAFRSDERLRNIEVELLVRRYRSSPAVQIIRVCEIAPDGTYELDYWCDICAIAMYELKDCDCCQGPIELRRRLLEK